MKKVLLTLLVSLCFGVIGIMWIGCSEDGMNPGDGLAGGQERFIDNGDGTVTDADTGLMWEKKTGTVGISVLCDSTDTCPDPHDVNNLYTWSRTGTVFDGGGRAQCSWCS